MVPIAFAYHVAHYLPAFLVEAQYAVRALSDPFNVGWDLFGTAHMHVKDSLRTHHLYIELTWYAQVAAIVIGARGGNPGRAHYCVWRSKSRFSTGLSPDSPHCIDGCLHVFRPLAAFSSNSMNHIAASYLWKLGV